MLCVGKVYADTHDYALPYILCKQGALVLSGLRPCILSPIFGSLHVPLITMAHQMFSLQSGSCLLLDMLEESEETS